MRLLRYEFPTSSALPHSRRASVARHADPASPFHPRRDRGRWGAAGAHRAWAPSVWGAMDSRAARHDAYSSRRLPQPRAHSPRARTWLTASWRHPRSLRNPGRSTGFTDCMPPESPGIRQTSIRAMTKHQSENTSSAAARTSAQSVRAEQSERKRAAILKASKEVLAQGYAEFSLRKVAAAAACGSAPCSIISAIWSRSFLQRSTPRPRSSCAIQTTGARPVRVPDR